MPTIYLEDPLGNQVRLTEERISHIMSRHSELQNRTQLIAQTVEEPHMVRTHPNRSDTRNYFRRFNEPGSGFLVRVAVIFNSDNQFVVTAHMMSSERLMRRGELMWEKAI
jgi:hypothetical protein